MGEGVKRSETAPIARLGMRSIVVRIALLQSHRTPRADGFGEDQLFDFPLLEVPKGGATIINSMSVALELRFRGGIIVHN